MSKESICLLTTAHTAYNPRLVKEADALAAAGYRVRVVAMNQEPEKWALDQALAATRPWRLEVVTAQRRGPGRALWLRAVFRQRCWQWTTRLLSTRGGRTRAYSRFAPELAHLAMQQRADLFISHTLPALPAAAYAARHWSAKLGFDLEDFPSGMRPLHAPPTREDLLEDAVESDYLPACVHLTAASPGVAAATAPRCGGRVPVAVLNVFRLAERPATRPPRRVGGPLRLYWFSQVVGTDRGLEDALGALRRLPEGAAELHLRGRCDAAARQYLDALMRATGVDGRRVIVHPPAPPDQLVAGCADYDVGLALEVPVSRNRMICMDDLCTNKVFTYLMGGLALAASALKQGGIIYEGAGFSYPSGDDGALAAGLRRWLDQPDGLQRARDKAWEVATTRYNWETEQHQFLATVARSLAAPTISSDRSKT